MAAIHEVKLTALVTTPEKPSQKTEPVTDPDADADADADRGWQTRRWTRLSTYPAGHVHTRRGASGLHDMSRSKSDSRTGGPPSDAWREHVLRWQFLLIVFFVPCCLLVILALALRPHASVLLALGLGWCVAMLAGFTRRLPYRLRAWLLVGILLVVAMGGYVAGGFVSGPALAWGLAVVTAGLCLGWRAMAQTVVMGTLGVAVIAWARVSGSLPPIVTSNILPTEPDAWLRTSLSAVMLITITGVSVMLVVDHLERTIERLRVAELRRLEAQQAAAHALKVEAIGCLAAGVAHDFNNLLTIVDTTASLLLEKLPGGSPEREEVQAMHEVVERGSALTRQLLSFARKTDGEILAFDANQRLRALASMLQRLCPPGVHTRLALCGEALPVKMDPSQLEQIVLNLVVNARDAMPSGGEVTIETAVEGQDLRLVVADKGQGMDEATRARALEPFFTTKPMGRGTGLGLWIVHQIARDAGGDLEIASAPGQGTRVAIHLPLAAPSS
jgi:signal transduction histidine kinase